MEYDPSQQNAINIYTEGLEKNKAKMLFAVSELGSDSPPFIQRILARDNEVIDLDFELENADACEEVNCELELTITSKASVELEQSITVLHEESVILLEDSIWNSFEINDLSVTNHFYFLPRQPNKTITILFNSQDRNVFIDYVVHNTSSSPNPQDWPWDHHSDRNRQDLL